MKQSDDKKKVKRNTKTNTKKIAGLISFVVAAMSLRAEVSEELQKEYILLEETVNCSKDGTHYIFNSCFNQIKNN